MKQLLITINPARLADTSWAGRYNTLPAYTKPWERVLELIKIYIL